jgi:hypothetical protein
MKPKKTVALFEEEQDHVTSLKPSLGTLDPGLDAGTPSLSLYCNFFIQLYIALQLQCLHATCPNFSTLIVGLARTAWQAAALTAQPSTTTAVKVGQGGSLF